MPDEVKTWVLTVLTKFAFIAKFEYDNPATTLLELEYKISFAVVVVG